MSEKPQAAKPKADKNKPYDVIVSIIHDDRSGKSTPVGKPTRYSFATEAEAQWLADEIKDRAEKEPK